MLSFLVPFRDADGTRTAAKDWILSRWRHFYPEAEFCIASDDGMDPFNKSLAVNNAAKLATGDIFAILDADTWIDRPHFERALSLIQRKVAPWVVPARTSFRLKQNVSEKIMRLAPGDPWPLITRKDAESVLPVVGFLHLMTRSAFEAVGGMDPRIRGWGGEDTAFTRAMDVVNGRHRKLSGTVYCLWHARPRDAQNNRLWLGQDRSLEQDKQALMHDYFKARTPADMLQLLGMQ